jgi:hypothetical protein
MKTEIYTDKEAVLAALHGGKRQRKRAPSPRSATTGLSTLIKLGWNVEWDSAMRLRLWRGERDTGYFDDERAACAKAREL